MSERKKNGLLRLPTSRLSRRIVLWVFISVIVIEAIIFIPSYMRRGEELLASIAEVSSAQVVVVSGLIGNDANSEMLYNRLAQLLSYRPIVGGTLYSEDGTEVGSFGERPQLSFTEVRRSGRTATLGADKSRYDTAMPLNVSGREHLLIIRNDASSAKAELRAFTFRIAALVVIISLFVTAGAWFALNPIVVTPVLRLRNDLIKAGDAVSQDQETPEFYSASVRRRDELGEVIAAFRQMFGQITDAIGRRKRAETALQESLEKVEAYSQELNNELDRGRQMQNNFLPARLPQFPGWEIETYFRPARQVAGDFYDIFELPQGDMGIVVADVCDKGVGAALFMALIRSLIRIFSGQSTLENLACPLTEALVPDSVSESDNPSSDAAQRLPLKAVELTNNYVVLNHGELGMFATLFFGVLEPGTGRLTYINAGHDPLLVIRATGGRKRRLKGTGPAVGIIEDAEFEIEQMVLKPGEMLLGYTDGVTEAFAPDGSFFGHKRLESIVDREAPSGKELLTKIAAGLRDHIGSAEQHDDITMVAVRRLD